MAAPILHETTEALEVAALHHRILRRIEPVLQAVGVDAHQVRCDVSGTLADLHVVLWGPSEVDTVRQAIGVRVLDAVRAAGRTLGAVTVDHRWHDDAARR